MAQRRRLGLPYLLGSLLVLTASLHPTTAYSAPGDPPAGSPAGAVYQLPLEQGRSDAAPKGSGGTGAAALGGSAGGGSGGGGGGASGGGGAASGGASGESASLYRSENDFGSSSRVPGTPAAGGAGGQAANGGSGGAASGGGDEGGAAAGKSNAAAAETADTGNASVSAGIVLLAGIALVAVAAGLLTRFRGRAVT